MTILTNIDRRFVVGETVHLRVRTSLPGTKTPTDVSRCRLTSLKLDGEETLSAAVAFTHDAEGDYSLVVATADLDPGSYTLLVTADSGPTSVSIIQDEFVLVSS